MKGRSARWVLIACLAVPALLAFPAEARPRDAHALTSQDVTWVGRLRYNPKRETILLPVSGLLPSLAWSNDPRTYRFKVDYLDLPGLGNLPAHLKTGTQRRFPEDRLVELILLGEPKPGFVRLVVRGTRPVQLVPKLVPYRGGWAVQVTVRPAVMPARRF